MPDLLWNNVRDYFDPELNGVLPDVHVPATTVADWQRLMDLVREQGWAYEYSVADRVVRLPSRATDLLRRPDDECVLLRGWPGRGILVNVFPRRTDRIDADVDLRELQGQERLDLLCRFFRTVGRRLRKPGHADLRRNAGRTDPRLRRGR